MHYFQGVSLFGSNFEKVSFASPAACVGRGWLCVGVMLRCFCVQGAGVEIYPGSVCCLVSNGIHHCKDGILIKVRREDS